MGTWIKSNGKKIELNDFYATEKYAESLGWKKESEKEPVKKKPVAKG